MTKVLVVDDNIDILEAVQLIFLDLGYDVLTLSRGEETEQKISEYSPDVVILDRLLSGCDGKVICERIKKNPATTNLPVIIMSAQPNAQLLIQTSGADGFIAKPFSIEELEEKVKKVLHKNEKNAQTVE